MDKSDLDFNPGHTQVAWKFGAWGFLIKLPRYKNVYVPLLLPWVQASKFFLFPTHHQCPLMQFTREKLVHRRGKNNLSIYGSKAYLENKIKQKSTHKKGIKNQTQTPSAALKKKNKKQNRKKPTTFVTLLFVCALPRRISAGDVSLWRQIDDFSTGGMSLTDLMV